MIGRRPFGLINLNDRSNRADRSTVQWEGALRIVAPVVVAIGLTGTVQIAASESERAEAAQEAEEARIIETFGEEVDAAADAVRDEARQIDIAVEALLAGDDESFGSLIEALDVFGEGSPIVAVELDAAGDVTLSVPEGSLGATEVPGSVVGVTATTEGRWADTLTYRQFDESVEMFDGPRSVAVVVGVDALLAPHAGGDLRSLNIAGMTGMPEVSSAAPTLSTVGSDIYVDPATRLLSANRQIEVLGEPATLEVGSATQLQVGLDSKRLKLIVSIGLLLTAIAGAATWFATRWLANRLNTRDHAAEAREASIARFRASFTHAPMGVVEIDEDGDILAVNPRFASKLGFLPEELLGVPMLDLIDGADRRAAMDQAASIRAHGSTAEQSERRYRTMNGAAVWMKESVSAIDAIDGTRHLLIQVEDISDERRSRAELRRRALYDELTGLPNRAHLISQLRLAVDTAEATGEEVAVMFVDLNKFKIVNDTMGHDAGDQILIEVAERLRSACRAGDIVARLGGDEFVIVCQGIADEQMASQAADRYFSVLNSPTTIDDAEVDISASIGLVVAGGDAEAEELLRNADKAMYHAKASDSNAVVEFDYSMKAETVDRLSQEVALRKAIDNGEFELYFQTIVDGHSLDVLGVEALVRWNHPRNGLTAPGEFLPLAEELGILEEIDRWALVEGIQTLARWSETSDVAGDWFLTVNTSPALYVDTTFADWVVDQLVDAGVEPRRLVLERPEHTAYDDESSSRGTIRELRSRGVHVSLDHFGVGQTPLSELSGLEVDSLKIGRSFIARATSREQMVLTAIAEMARSLGMEIMAEGIESQAELDIALAAGVVRAQGYHFSRPVDAATLSASGLLEQTSVNSAAAG